VPQAEPHPDLLSHPLPRLLLATRPAFLTASALAVLLGLASARHAGVPVDPLLAAVTMAGALVIHAGVNVLNDYYDALNGADEANAGRIHPFTGGSRFIQNGLLTPARTARLGWALLATGAAIGLFLAWQTGPALVALGLVGMVVGWGYSARSLRLNARGLGELAVAAGFGGFVPVGTFWVQGGETVWGALVGGLPFGLLALNLLFVNQFPDARADAAAGKHHLVVRLGPRWGRWLYGLFAGLAYGWTAVAVARGWLPMAALGALLPVVLSLRAWRDLLRWAETPAFLEPAIRRTISAMAAYALILMLALAGA
jgi:1,4-dihydroxy-2-naphthoate octaprenyltransferase